MATQFTPNRRQRGAALITGLILLVALTIIGVVAISNTGLEQRMAANMADKSVAFNAADSALRAIEQRYADDTVENPESLPNCPPEAGPVECVLDISSHTLKESANGPDWWLDSAHDHDWWSANARPYQAATNGKLLDGPKTQPHYIVEEIQHQKYSATLGHARDSGGTNYYRVTARGTGITDKSEVIVQTTITRPKEN